MTIAQHTCLLAFLMNLIRLGFMVVLDDDTTTADYVGVVSSMVLFGIGVLA